MGAANFSVTVVGKTADAAFDSAVRDARYENGHGGYTGTIAEKHGFVMIRDKVEDVIARLDKRASQPFDKDEFYSEAAWKDSQAYAKKLASSLRKNKKDYGLMAYALVSELNDPRVSDTWGDAGCIEVGKGKFLFFGMASE